MYALWGFQREHGHLRLQPSGGVSHEGQTICRQHLTPLVRQKHVFMKPTSICRICQHTEALACWRISFSGLSPVPTALSVVHATLRLFNLALNLATHQALATGWRSS